MLSILVWWSVPIVALCAAAVFTAVARRVRQARADMFTTERYARARSTLARSQRDFDHADLDGRPGRQN